MRWIIVLVSVLAAAVVAGLFLVPRLTGSGAGVSEERTAASAADGADVSRGVDSAQGPERDAASRDEALVRLQEELEQAAPVEGMSDEERLADAWAWVKANRPEDRPYNELEAKMLTLIGVIFDGEERSALWAMNTSLIEEEMIRALDADGDGTVTDEEVARFAEENITILGALDHPYIKAKLDANGDGELSPNEVEKLQNIAKMEGAFAGLLERAKLDRWDADGDGMLSDGERQTGRSLLEGQVKFFADGHVELVDDPSQLDAAEQEQVKAALSEKFGPDVLEALDSQRGLFANQALAQSLMEAMRVENMDQNELRAQIMSNIPKAPQESGFDVDGDGVQSESEASAYQQAMKDYQNQMKEWAAQQSAIALQLEFGHAMSESDGNSDGRMSADEWDRRLEELVAARDARLFLRSYDFDRSGRVDQGEVMRFLDWYNGGSLRADANFDGVIDARDLELMTSNYQRQGG